MLDYNPETGVFVWKIYRSGTAKVGFVAGHLNRDGARQIGINGWVYNAGVLAWAYVHGDFLVGRIDHKNRDAGDNRISNLRVCKNYQNVANRGPLKKNKYKGVYFEKRRNRWYALIQKNGRKDHLGMFKTEIEAAAAYDAASKKRFGEFAYLNFPEGTQI